MSLLNDIKKTIKYAQKYRARLSWEQLWFRLLSNKIYSKEEIKNNFQIDNFSLKGFPSVTTSSKLQVPINKENKKKIKLARELTKKHLSKFNDILMVGVTGSVAAENAKKQEDIDMFIICKKDTLWLTRLKLRLYIKLKNIPHRRYGKKEKPNDFCFNLWMDESSLTVPKLKQNQKNAVDLIMVKIILNRNNIYEKFVLENDWVKKYVANGYNQLKISNFQFPISKSKTSIIDKSLNYLAYVLQIMYIRLKGPIKFINLRQAFFHK